MSPVCVCRHTHTGDIELTHTHTHTQKKRKLRRTSSSQKKEKLRPAIKLLDAMEFAVGIDAYLLHLALREETDQRSFRNSTIDQW